ncbi:MAG: sulfatase-like hydrolase/transferase [Desulforhopalus sp.]|nr:sulfatase-like hydrolase/transferase [Desulforhopalus sp.]
MQSPSFFQFRSFPLKARGITLRKAGRAIAPFLVVTAIVLTISLSFGLVGGIDEYLLAFRFELPFLLLAFAALLYCLRPGALRVLIAAAPIIVLYLGMDLYYTFMSSIAKLDDLLLLPEGLIVSPAWVQISVWAAFLSWVLTFLFLLKRRPVELVIPSVLVALAAAPLIMVFTAPAQFLKMADSRGVNIVPWSDRWTVALMGRATSLMLFAAAKHKAAGELALMPMFDDPGRDPALLKSSLQEKRNIHIIVLESFLDPERFKGLQFKTPPSPPEFTEVRKKLHVATSTVFGGGTAQAEFEILCGVPALEIYTSAEFNMLDGAKTPCLPNMLAEVGYRTIATQSYKPDFFNSEKAYRSIGFEEINFPTVFAGNRTTYLKHEDPKNYIFDGDLFVQNLAYVEKVMAEGRPILNYVLGTYGHLPHHTDVARFPPKVEIVGVEKDSQTYLAIQQFYYRAGALADYIKKLKALDPRGLIVVTSDHLPALDGGPRFYEKLGYTLLTASGEYKQNIWFYDGPVHKKLAWPDFHYEFMDFILDVLTEERICRQMVCKNREAWASDKITASYNNLMSRGAGIARQPTPLVVDYPSPQQAPLAEVAETPQIQ